MPTIEQLANHLKVDVNTIQYTAEKYLSHQTNPLWYNAALGTISTTGARIIHDALIQEGILTEPSPDLWATQLWRNPKFYGP